MIVIETDRLILRTIKLEDDARSIIELLNDEAWLENIGDRNVHDIKSANQYIKSMQDDYEKNGFGSYAVTLKRSGDFIGTCGLFVRDHLDFPDIGYALLSAYRGYGYALEAAKGTLAYAKDQLNLTRILAFTKSDNERSKNLLLNAGMSHQGKIPYKDGVLDDLFSIEF